MPLKETKIVGGHGMPIRDKLIGKKVNGLNSKGNLNIIIFLEIYAKEFG